VNRVATSSIIRPDDGRPRTYARAFELIAGGQIDVSCFLTHRYATLAEARGAFERDRFEPAYVKGVLVLLDHHG
jgi:threonine dehydrogenase-like Zn-dependent dehydrogenase